MPDDNSTQAAPVAAPAPVAPSTQAAPTAPPNLSSLSQSGAAVPSGPSPEEAQVGGASYNSAMAASVQAQQKANALENSPPPPPMKHARLLAMIDGLGAGLSAAGTSLSTHGREGGAAEAQQILGAQSQERIQKQQAATEQKNAQIQQYLTIADTNQKLAQSIILMATMPTDLKLKDLQLTEAQQNIASGRASLANTQAEFMSTYGMTPEQFTGMMSGTATPDQKTTQNLQGFSQQKVDAAAQILPTDDPYIQKAQTILKDPNATPQQVFGAVASVNRQVALHQQVMAAKTATEAAAANSPVGKLSTPEALAAPGAQAAIQAKIDDPKTDPADIPRLQALLPRATLAQKNAATLEAAKERTQQAITNGDPVSAGALLYSGLVSPKELISSRQPAFAQRAFDEALRLGGGVKGPDGKWTASSWSAVKAEAQYEYAENPKTQNTLNLLTTMRAPGGSIDIAKKAFDAIPGKIDSTTFNKIMNGTITQFGGQSVTDFKAAMTSLADEYAQVLQGGAATETTLSQARDLIQQAYTKSQGAGAFDVIGQDMAARQKGMIRDNPTLMQIYPETGTGAGNQTQVDPNDPFAAFGGKQKPQ